MDWQPIDFQGIASLEDTLSKQLEKYLIYKESILSHIIASSLASYDGRNRPALEKPSDHYKLSESVEAFSQRLKQLQKSHLISIDWKKVIARLNTAIWEYVELLEGSAVELFQQLDQIGFEYWRSSLVSVVEKIKETLSHSMEDLKKAVAQLNALIQNNNSDSFLKKMLQRLLSFSSVGIDKGISRNIERSQKFLNFRFQNFIQRYAQYQELENKIDQMVQKFQDYHVLNSIDNDEQHKFRILYRLLKLWELNTQVKALPELEIIRGIRRLIDPAKACQVFKDYFQAIKSKLFNSSRELKQGEGLFSQEDKKELMDNLHCQRAELHTLSATVAKYREFLFKSDPSPYVRTQSGLSDWKIGQEPPLSLTLQNQEYDIESLNALYLKFCANLQHHLELEDDVSTGQIYQELIDLLHDMGQPLATQAMLEVRADKFVNRLQELDELSSTDAGIVPRMTSLLSRVMRADWRYNVLFALPGFHEVYKIHQGLLGTSRDRVHLGRLGEFKRLIERLQYWIKERKVTQHLHEIELDVNDIKSALQDLLAHIQRLIRDPALMSNGNASYLENELSRQLMEYRYLFGNFFYQLRNQELDERLLRSQLLFVDHYFESIENKLIEMRNLIRDA